MRVQIIQVYVRANTRLNACTYRHLTVYRRHVHLCIDSSLYVCVLVHAYQSIHFSEGKLTPQANQIYM